MSIKALWLWIIFGIKMLLIWIHVIIPYTLHLLEMDNWHSNMVQYVWLIVFEVQQTIGDIVSLSHF